MEEMKRYPAVPGVAEVTAKLIDVLCKGRPGDVLTDNQLKEACGQETRVGGQAYANLATAIGRCVREHGILWQRQRGANAIKCLCSDEKLNTVRTERTLTHRRITRTLRKLMTIALNELEQPKQAEALSLQAQLGGLELISRTSTTKALIERKVNEQPKLEDTLAMFSRRSQ